MKGKPLKYPFCPKTIILNGSCYGCQEEYEGHKGSHEYIVDEEDIVLPLSRKDELLRECLAYINDDVIYAESQIQDLITRIRKELGE